MSTWSLDPEEYEHVRWQTVLLLADAEHVSYVLGGRNGGAPVEFRRIIEGPVLSRVVDGLRDLGCPDGEAEQAARDLIAAAAEWTVQRDAMLRPTEGCA